MSRSAWIAVVSTSVFVTLILGFTYSCWDADCPLAAGDSCIASGCDNLLGVSFEGGRFPLTPILVTLLLGLALGGLVGVTISKLRSRGA